MLGFASFFRNKFPGLFKDFSRTQIDFSRSLKFTWTLSLPRYQCYFSLLSVTHFIFLTQRNSSITDFQNFQGPVSFFQHFPVMENATTKFQDFTGFPGPVRTLYLIMLCFFCFVLFLLFCFVFCCCCFCCGKYVQCSFCFSFFFLLYCIFFVLYCNYVI